MRISLSLVAAAAVLSFVASPALADRAPFDVIGKPRVVIGAKNEPVILTGPHPIEAGGRQDFEVGGLRYGTPRHLRGDDTDLTAIAPRIGIPDFLRR